MSVCPIFVVVGTRTTIERRVNSEQEGNHNRKTYVDIGGGGDDIA